jgi:hypothetical protein
MSNERESARPLVSVILPTFNRLIYLRTAVESVFAQTFADWELIVADDGSEGETRDYLRSLAARPRVRVLWLPHSGNPGAVRNAAIGQAQGAYIAFLDSDDLWMASKLELQLAALRACPERQWSYTAIVQINETGEQIYADSSAYCEEGQIFEHLLTSRAGVATPAVMVSRQLLARAGGFDGRQPQCEDYHLWLRLAMLCEVSVLRQPLACVRRHNEQFHITGIGSLVEKGRMLERIATLASSSSQAAALRTARAGTAAALAVANAAAGASEAAWRTLAESGRFSWRRAIWWMAIVRVLAHTCVPARLLALAKEYRRAARHAVPPP